MNPDKFRPFSKQKGAFHGLVLQESGSPTTGCRTLQELSARELLATTVVASDPPPRRYGTGWHRALLILQENLKQLLISNAMYRWTDTITNRTRVLAEYASLFGERL